jgi:hypothetical protein
MNSNPTNQDSCKDKPFHVDQLIIQLLNHLPDYQRLGIIYAWQEGLFLIEAIVQNRNEPVATTKHRSSLLFDSSFVTKGQ